MGVSKNSGLLGKDMFTRPTHHVIGSARLLREVNTTRKLSPRVRHAHHSQFVSPFILSCVLHGVAIGLLTLMGVPTSTPSSPPIQVTLIERASQQAPTTPSLSQTAKPAPSLPPAPSFLSKSRARTAGPVALSTIPFPDVNVLSHSVPALRVAKETRHPAAGSIHQKASSSRFLKDRMAEGWLSARVPAQLKDNPLPSYPQQARKAGWEGQTMLRVEVLEDGTPGAIEIKHSCGHAILDQAAIKAVRAWTFFPERDGMFTVRSVVDLPIRFHLQHFS